MHAHAYTHTQTHVQTHTQQDVKILLTELVQEACACLHQLQSVEEDVLVQHRSTVSTEGILYRAYLYARVIDTCMYAYVFLCAWDTYTRTNSHTHAHTHTHTHEQTHAQTHAHTRTHTHTLHTFAYVCIVNC